MKGFRHFILRGNLVDLAVAVVIGSQFSGLVNQFVSSFVDPLLGLIGAKPNFSKHSFRIKNSTFTYGAFITQAVSFLIAAAAVYFVIVLPVARLFHLVERDKAAIEKDCPHCARSIPVAAKRCPECTTVLERPPGTAVQPSDGLR